MLEAKNIAMIGYLIGLKYEKMRSKDVDNSGVAENSEFHII